MNGFKDYYLKLSYWQQYGLKNIAIFNQPGSQILPAETDLIKIWQQQSFERRNLATSAGERVYVKFPGQLDSRGIFRKAELFLGEPQPHFLPTDIYPGYVPKTGEGYGIFLSGEKIKKSSPNIIFLSPRSASVPDCRQDIELLDWHFLLRFICLAGEARILRRQKSLFSEREEFIYQGVLRALGYGSNKEKFHSLAKVIPWSELVWRLKKVPVKLYPEFVRAVFFQVGGLFPEKFIDVEAEKYEQYLKNVLQNYFPNCPKNVVGGWDLSKCRPVNYPWRRIAGFGYIVSRLGEFDLNWEKLLENWIGRITRATGRRELLQAYGFLVRWFYLPAQPRDYFFSRYKFGEKSGWHLPGFLGENRAGSLVINTFLPAAVYFARKNNYSQLEDKLWKFYYSLPVLEPNRQARKIWSKVLPEKLVEKNFLLNREVLNQGWLQIADDFCNQTSCEKCVLPTIFRRKIIDPEFC